MRQVKRILVLLLSLAFLLMPVPSTSAEEASAETGNTSVSAESAVETAATVTRVQEIEFLREKNSETFLLSDGKFECVVYVDNKYYMDANEELKLIDNSIVPTQKTGPLVSESGKGVYRNAANEFDIFFGDATEPKVDIQYQGKAVTFAPLTATRKDSGKELRTLSLGKVENCTTLEELTPTGSNTVTYKNVFVDADLVYVLSNNALKEYVVLHSADADNTYSFLFTMEGVKLQETEKYAEFVDEKGNAVFALDSLFAVDAGGVLTEDLTYSFTPVEDTNNVVVTVTLDEDYMKAPDRAFPVVIDPTIMISSSETADACVCSYTLNTNYQMATQLRTGFDVDYGIRRSYIKFNIPDGIPQNSITSATLDIEKLSGSAPTTKAYMCHSEWSSGTITWNNKVGYYNAYESTQAVQRTSGSSWYSMNVTTIVKMWETNPNYGFVVRDVNEDDINHWTTLYSSDAPSPHKPELHITYEGGSVNIQPLYDSAYVGKYGNNVDQRITAYMDVLHEKYMDEFGIWVTYSTPTLFTSYATECVVDANHLCTCGGLTACNNSKITINGDVIFEELHHTNIYNIVGDIGKPTSTDTVKMVFLGQKMCYNMGGCQPFRSLGQTFEHISLATVMNHESIPPEYVTVVHELGHLYGIIDHYGPEMGNFDTKTTQQMNDTYGNIGFSTFCIYGENKEDVDVLAEMTICDGCKSFVYENRNLYSN